MGLFSDELLRLLLYCVPLWDNMKPTARWIAIFWGGTRFWIEEKKRVIAKMSHMAWLRMPFETERTLYSRLWMPPARGKAAGSAKSFSSIWSEIFRMNWRNDRPVRISRNEIRSLSRFRLSTFVSTLENCCLAHWDNAVIARSEATWQSLKFSENSKNPTNALTNRPE